MFSINGFLYTEQQVRYSMEQAALRNYLAVASASLPFQLYVVPPQYAVAAPMQSFQPPSPPVFKPIAVTPPPRSPIHEASPPAGLTSPISSASSRSAFGRVGASPLSPPSHSPDEELAQLRIDIQGAETQLDAAILLNDLAMSPAKPEESLPAPAMDGPVEAMATERETPPLRKKKVKKKSLSGKASKKVSKKQALAAAKTESVAAKKLHKKRVWWDMVEIPETDQSQQADDTSDPYKDLSVVERVKLKRQKCKAQPADAGTKQSEIEGSDSETETDVSEKEKSDWETSDSESVSDHEKEMDAVREPTSPKKRKAKSEKVDKSGKVDSPSVTKLKNPELTAKVKSILSEIDSDKKLKEEFAKFNFTNGREREHTLRDDESEDHERLKKDADKRHGYNFEKRLRELKAMDPIPEIRAIRIIKIYNAIMKDRDQAS